MERIRFHPESCKWSKKKNQSLKKEKENPINAKARRKKRKNMPRESRKTK